MNEEVIEILSDIRSGYNCFDVNEEPKYRALSVAIDALKEHKIGKWINALYVGNDNYDFECSVCGFRDTHSKDVDVPFCWHCGARMEGAEE